ncbi:cobalt/nickel transport system permease protein [Clostridium cavendishii DSM 21758]|uniref:Cobalt/nickel transport system permease protein n=1 Tax=Clostridium cavendishii DSM 21758 TaxID=1121302 RepID=A0A1M6BF76_9CLOT|nr:cobalt transporter CbiM [Clostridium cavendishii]SHI47392.1 cobalt/nickel transport system permease protein [Clostridium cavendishii DSM 21758]
MHIPDNYLSPSTCAVMGGVMVPIWKKAVEKVKKEVTRKKMPLMGVGASLSFLTMMFNIPLPGGTTGHAVGGTLLAILLGPEAACISITIALLIQALLFGDGGILAFGANCFNMAFAIPFVGYYVYKFLKEKLRTEKAEYIAIFIAAYIGINIGALCASIEFGIQPLFFKDAAGMPLYCPYPLAITIPSMIIPHLLVAGFLEGIITVGVLGFIKKVSPGSIYEGATTKMKPIYAFLILVVCLTPLGLLATGTAWGEWGTDEISSVITGGKELGFVPKGMENGFNFNTLMPEYSIKGLSDNFGYILSAIAGVAILLIIFRIIASMKKDTKSVND